MANVRQLTPELAKKAQETLGEKPVGLKDDIDALRSWIEKQPHLIGRTDDQFILTFLRCCKFSLEESKKRIDAYFTSKTVYPELFKNRPVDTTSLDILRCGVHTIPPNPLPNTGPRLFISQMGRYDPKKHSLADVFRVLFMFFEMLAFEDDCTAVNGIEHIYDLQNCSFQHVLQFDPIVLKKVYVYLEQCVPIRIARAHVINLRKELQGAYKFARNFLPSELPFEVIIHEEESDLYNYIPRESIISEYGGKNGSQSEILQEWERKFQDRAEYFEQDSHYGTNEKLRVDSKVSLQTDFGIEGSFRKLEVD